MELKQIEVYTEQTNYAIVRMPGRNFPGCVIQGDSLSILLNCVERAMALAQTTNQQELLGELDVLHEAIHDRLVHYERVIKAHGFLASASGSLQWQLQGSPKR